MKLKLKLNYIVENISYKYLKNNNVLFFKNSIGFIKLYLPMYFFVKENKNKIYFLLQKKNYFFSILKQFFTFYKYLIRFFFFKLRLRGLGYRIKKITKKLYRFFFAYNHYFYFHISIDLFVRYKSRNILIFCNNLMKLNDVFSHLLLLKKLDFYERNNTFIISKKILFLKKRK